MNIKNFKYKLQRLKYQTIDGFMFIQLFEMGFVIFIIPMHLRGILSIRGFSNIGLFLGYLLAIIIEIITLIYYESSEWDWRLKRYNDTYTIQYKNIFGIWRHFEAGWNLRRKLESLENDSQAKDFIKQYKITRQNEIIKDFKKKIYNKQKIFIY